MCATGECRSCRLEARLLDKAMGSARTYQRSAPRTIEQNASGGRVMGNSLISARKYNINNEPAPVNYMREDHTPPEPPRRTLTKSERMTAVRNARKEDRVLVDGRLESQDCPCHGTYNGYLNWYCRCIPCSEAATQHRLEASQKGPHIPVTKEERAAQKRKLYDERVKDRELIDGRWVARNAPEHATPNSYINWVCRCIPCSEAYSNRSNKT